MTITQRRAEPAAPSAWRRMRLWALAHAVDDLYQGLVPSVVKLGQDYLPARPGTAAGVTLGLLLDTFGRLAPR